jgi:predicted AAA+ superfamily ATPase
LTIDHQTKIQILQQLIQEYQTKYPQRNQEQKYELSCLWLELAYWQLVVEGKIKLDLLFFKVQEFWENLKRSYQRRGEWPYEELRDFLAKQPEEYAEYLIGFIKKENEREYLNLARWLSKMLKGFGK